MQVVTWNVGQRRASVLEALAGICTPDLITLQEVGLGRPCIVTGDFNEPQFAIQNGRVVTWGQERVGRRFACWRRWSFHGRMGTGEQWDTAVRWLFEKQDEHGLRHAYWDASGQGKRDVSHVSRGQKQWFDHIFVSADFRVGPCRYLHKLRGPGLSDHSALTARLTLGARRTRRSG
jgi:endonuclease/exonuclease/phosphatase family metal-dependent hydrolase